VWQGDIALVPALTMSDVDQQASAIAIGDLPMSPLLQAEPTGVERGQAHAVAGESHAAKKPVDLFAAEAHRQLLLPWWSHDGEDGPVAIEGMLEEELDATQCNCARAPRVLLDMLEVEAILSEFFLGEHVRKRSDFGSPGFMAVITSTSMRMFPNCSISRM
jgi:hypothetical protein